MFTTTASGVNTSTRMRGWGDVRALARKIIIKDLEHSFRMAACSILLTREEVEGRELGGDSWQKCIKL